MQFSRSRVIDLLSEVVGMRTFFLLLVIGSLMAAPGGDMVSTSAGNVKITPVLHGTVLIEIEDRAWYVDPWSRADYSSLPKADVILITDIHGDHMDPKAIAAIRKADTRIVGPAAVAKTVTEIKILANGETTELHGVEIEAIPMYNVQRGPAPGKLFHDKGRGNGYVLTVGGKRFYFSGDTEGVAEMRNLKNIDVAFVCMNLPYTMPPEEAADAVKAFKPKVVYPYHYRGSDLKVFAAGLEGQGVEIRERKWY
ncbi:MAG: MBL fold metallo-hydrolase [Bryobacterales bacterium]|nr:MBL fold metallo-hydrolase [Bryobacterales bacterium]